MRYGYDESRGISVSYKVWRRVSDNSVVGFCDAGYDGFEPGGDNTQYTITVEKDVPTFPSAAPTLASVKMKAMLTDPTVPQTVKDYLSTLC